MKQLVLLLIFLFIDVHSAHAGVSCIPGGLNCSTQDSTSTNTSSEADAFSDIPGSPPSILGSSPRPSPTSLTPTNTGTDSAPGTPNSGGQQNGNNAPNNNTGFNGGGGFDSCVNQAQALISECSTKSDSAVSNCDTSSNSSLTSSMGTAAQMTTAMSSSTPSASGACSNMGIIGASAQAALAGYQTTCSSAKNSCLEVCENARKSMAECAARSGMSLYSIQATEGFRDVSAHYGRCSSQQAKVDQAGSALANIMSETQKAKECAAQLAAMNTPSSDPNSAYCRAHPTVASCILDCNHPNMVSNQTCICMKNPFDASCGAASSSGTIAGNFNNASGGGAQTKTAKSNPSLGSDSFDIDRLNEIATDGRRAMAAQAAENSGGKQGGSAALGSITPDTGGGAKGNGSGLPPDMPTGSNVNSGFYGAGGGSGSGYGSGGGEGNGGGGGYAGANGGNAARGPGAPDLRQFLPGGQMDPARRGIAGINGVDGISGPNETNWAKMQRRYRYLGSTFLP